MTFLPHHPLCDHIRTLAYVTCDHIRILAYVFCDHIIPLWHICHTRGFFCTLCRLGLDNRGTLGLWDEEYAGVGSP